MNLAVVEAVYIGSALSPPLLVRYGFFLVPDPPRPWVRDMIRDQPLWYEMGFLFIRGSPLWYEMGFR